jgi:hypothetical protein
MCGLNGYAPNRPDAVPAADAASPTPSETLLARLALPIRAAATVADLCSRPIRTTPVVSLPTREHRRPEAEAA